MYRIIIRNCNKIVTQRTALNQIKRYGNQGYVRQAGFGKYVVILAPFAITGGIITYAKYDKQFRNTLIDNVPGAEAVLKIFIPEEKPLQNISKQVDSFKTKLTGLFGGSTDNIQEPQQAKKTEVGEVAKSENSAESRTPAKKPVSYVRDEKPKAAQVVKPPESIPTEIAELEKSVDLATSIAIQEYHKAIQLLKSYNEDIQKVVDQAVEATDLSSWATLRNKTKARDSAIELAEDSARKATKTIEQCELLLSKQAPTIDQKRLEEVRSKIKLSSEHISEIKSELYKVKNNADFSEKYWRKVENARHYFIDEIESLFPGLNLSDKKLSLSKEDLDLFILYAYSHVLAYQKELQKLQLDGELRLKRAMEALRGDDQTEAVKAQVEFYLDKERRNIALDNQKKIFQLKADTEKQLRKQLKMQSEAHVDHINDALAQKESELKRAFMRELDEKLSSEKAAYKLQLASMLGKLKGMDAALKARAKSEKSAHQAQSLWAACQALWASIRSGEPGVHWREKLRPLKNEISAVYHAAADGDELVTIVLQNLPIEVQDRGVYPEDALRERFLRVEKAARRLALVPEEGANLPVYLLSYLQSFFVLKSEDKIPEEELQDQPVDFSKLDTYDVLSRARYYLDRGDLVQSLKYMNLLQGAPRKVAKDWLKEARLLLETQQAANTLMAHAAASGLLYL